MRCILVTALAFTLVGSPAAAAQARCSDRPGVHRWSMKTSVPQGALSRTPIEIDLQDFLTFESLPVRRNEYLDESYP